MGEHLNLNTSGTQCIGAYLAKPNGHPKGGIVVVQEIFGVNAHIRSVADKYASFGYVAIAPAFFDHIETDVQLGYDDANFARGKSLAGQVGFERAVEDVASAAESIASAGKIGVVGFCWGGTVAFLAAIRLGLPAVSYYGAGNARFLSEKPKAPVQFHFGEQDSSIPPEIIQKHRDALPEMDVYSYPSAGHAFNRDIDPSHYDAAAAKLAQDRALDFFRRNVG
ncbi:MAG: dienelactone hydrolase family protein [Rudaea sp.]